MTMVVVAPNKHVPQAKNVKVIQVLKSMMNAAATAISHV
jgi:hypothetical protein